MLATASDRRGEIGHGHGHHPAGPLVKVKGSTDASASPM
jgi:hypothetical protein